MHSSLKSVFTVNVRFELTTNGPHNLSTTPFIKELVRWATAKRLTDRLPKLSLTTLSPFLNSGVFDLGMGPYVPSPPSPGFID